jgi:hypothetical protein
MLYDSIHALRCAAKRTGVNHMATTQELRQAKEQGKLAFHHGLRNPAHPRVAGGGELYEAWYDGWDEAVTEYEDSIA